MIDFIKPFDVAANLAALADPAIRIVSLTVTEGGYYVSPATQHFDPAHPDIVADSRTPDAPKTAFGLIVGGPEEAARRRRRALYGHVLRQSSGQRPCDGERRRRPRRNVRSGACRTGSAANVAFPNAMVDRITPATTDRERAILKDKWGVEDNWPVFCEEFRQWVVEDKFPAGRPALEKVGVTFTGDVAPYELMKIRILNGGHAAIAYPAGLLDIHFVHEAMEDRQIAEFLETLTKREIIPVVPPPPNVDLEAYRRKVAERFANPKIGDTISRLCLDGSNRQPKFILPTRARPAQGGRERQGPGARARPCGAAIATANPRAASRSRPTIRTGTACRRRRSPRAADPKAWLAMGDIFGDLATNPAYVGAFSSALASLWSKGVRATLADYLGGRARPETAKRSSARGRER